MFKAAHRKCIITGISELSLNRPGSQSAGANTRVVKQKKEKRKKSSLGFKRKESIPLVSVYFTTLVFAASLLRELL